MKSFLDHLGVHWFAHRPDPVMFDKTAVIHTQSIGAPNGAAQKDVATSLQWLGISNIRKIGFGMMEGVVWDEISKERREKFEKKIRLFAARFQTVKSAKMSLKTKALFQMTKKMQSEQLNNTDPSMRSLDTQYWLDRGWISE